MSRYFPDFESFQSLAGKSDLVPVYRQLVSDTLTPVSRPYCRIQEGEWRVLVRKRDRGRAGRPLRFLEFMPFCESTPSGTASSSMARRAQKLVKWPTPSEEPNGFWPDTGPCICRGCRVFAARTWAMPVTTSCVCRESAAQTA